MKIRIKNTDKFPIWSIPEANIHLTFEENDFLSIDLNTINDSVKKIIWLNVAQGVLEVEGFQELEQSLFPKEDKTTEPNKSTLPPGKAKEVKELLSHGVASLRRLLPDLDNMSLDIAKNLEKEGKNRKTVFSIITDLQERRQKKDLDSIAESVSREDGSGKKQSIFTGKEKLFQGLISDVEESVDEDIIIHIGDSNDNPEGDNS